MTAAIRVEETLWITLADGCRLAARLWLPPEGTRTRPGHSRVPALSPAGPASRRRRHPAPGLRCRRLCGDPRRHARLPAIPTASCTDEYLPRELGRRSRGDRLDRAAALVQRRGRHDRASPGAASTGCRSPRCAPPALKAVVTACSTDDRYADDMHYMGGCLLSDNLQCGSTMLHLRSRRRPTRPSSASAGARSGCSAWQQWSRRRPRAGCSTSDRDAYWRSGSVCEDYGGDRVRRARRRRLGRRLHQRGAAPADGRSRCPRKGAHRPVGPCLPARRHARARDRLPRLCRCAGGITG